MRGPWKILSVAAVLAAGLFAIEAHAQGTVRQSGPVTAFHPSAWFGNGVVGDAGTPADPFLNSLGLFNGANCPFGISSQTKPGISTAPGAQLTICQSATTTTFNLSGLNGQAAPNLVFNVGGTIFPLAAPPTINARTLGATGNGVTDDTASLQLCISQAEASSIIGVCYIPVGTYRTTSPLTVSSSVSLRGDGAAQSLIIPALSSVGIAITTTTPVTMLNMGVSYAAAANNGIAAITLGAAAGTLNTESTFRDLHIVNANIGIEITQGAAWMIDNVKIENYANVGIIAENGVPPNDEGDSVVADSYIQASNGANACIQWVGGGALYFHHNTCVGNGAESYGVLAQLPAGAATGQMLIQGNTFDANGIIGLTFIRSGATGLFGRLDFSGNICNQALSCLTIPTDPNGNAIADVGVVNNRYFGANSASAKFISIDSTTNLYIGANTLNSQNAGTVGYTIGSAVSGCKIDPEQRTGAFAVDSVASSCSGFATTWGAFTPAPSCGTAAFTTNTAQYKESGKLVQFEADFTFTSLGTCSGNPITFTLPKAAKEIFAWGGQEIGATGFAVPCHVIALSANPTCLRFDGSSTWSNGNRIIVSGSYEEP